MEGLAPPMKLVLSIKYGMDRGDSVRTALQKYFENRQDEFSQQVFKWYGLLQVGNSPQEVLSSLKSPYRKALLSVLERGLRGEPIYTVLLQLEQEMAEAARDEMERFVAVLPVKMLLPLLLLQFPAYLILLLGPLLKSFLTST